MGSWMLGTKVDCHVCNQLFLNRNYRAKKKELSASLKLLRAKIQNSTENNFLVLCLEIRVGTVSWL